MIWVKSRNLNLTKWNVECVRTLFQFFTDISVFNKELITLAISSYSVYRILDVFMKHLYQQIMLFLPLIWNLNLTVLYHFHYCHLTPNLNYVNYSEDVHPCIPLLPNSAHTDTNTHIHRHIQNLSSIESVWKFEVTNYLYITVQNPSVALYLIYNETQNLSCLVMIWLPFTSVVSFPTPLSGSLYYLPSTIPCTVLKGLPPEMQMDSSITSLNDYRNVMYYLYQQHPETVLFVLTTLVVIQYYLFICILFSFENINSQQHRLFCPAMQLSN
jgi:hypothetical protein